MNARVSERMATHEVGFGRLQHWEQLGVSSHCRALRPRRVGGERKARSEGASCLRQGESVISLVGEEKRGSLNESWLVFHA